MEWYNDKELELENISIRLSLIIAIDYFPDGIFLDGLSAMRSGNKNLMMELQGQLSKEICMACKILIIMAALLVYLKYAVSRFTTSQPEFTSSKSTMESTEHCMKSVQS